eukprot:10017554-Alexandrium_andersonii.AAC.1
MQEPLRSSQCPGGGSVAGEREGPMNDALRCELAQDRRVVAGLAAAQRLAAVLAGPQFRRC